MKRINIFYKLLAPALAMLLLAGCGAPATQSDDTAVTADSASMEKHESQLFAMDTVILLTCYGPNGELALEAASERINELEADLDPEREGSSVHAMNAGAGLPVGVSADCLALVQTAMTVYDRSGGALDPGIYPLSCLWGFIDSEYYLPTAEEIAAAQQRPSTSLVTWDEGDGTVTVPYGAQLSFGAVAKGYAADAALAAMAEAGADSAIVSLGGNVQTLGDTRPDGKRWTVAIVDPRDTGAYACTLSTGEIAVVTSGGYQRYFEQDGVTYIHILDPVTGYPVDNGLLSVSVLCADGAMADALTTALFVLGEQGAIDYWRAWGGFEMVIITEDNRLIATPGLQDTLTMATDEYTLCFLTEEAGA